MSLWLYYIFLFYHKTPDFGVRKGQMHCILLLELIKRELHYLFLPALHKSLQSKHSDALFPFGFHLSIDCNVYVLHVE